MKAFKMARYVMLTQNPEDDVNSYMENWARRSGLLEFQPDAMRIGWDFPFAISEMQKEADYAVITIHDPFAAALGRIPNAYKRLMDFLQANGFCEKPKEGILSCFEHVYEEGGITCMDVYIHVDSVLRTDSFTNFS